MEIKNNFGINIVLASLIIGVIYIIILYFTV